MIVIQITKNALNARLKDVQFVKIQLIAYNVIQSTICLHQKHHALLIAYIIRVKLIIFYNYN